LLFLTLTSTLYPEEIIPNDPYYNLQWEFHRSHQDYLPFPDGINVPMAWKIRTEATSVIVAIIDTGICYTHEDLAANMWHEDNPIYGTIHGWNFSVSQDDPKKSDPMDDSGHGTMCAGIIGACGNNNIGITGIAWKVQLMACKCVDENNNATDSDIIACIDYVCNFSTKDQKVILNLSLGRPGTSTEFSAFQEALKRAQSKNIIIVTAAGNNGKNNDSQPEYPASCGLDNVLAVAATNASDRLVQNSNYGPKTVHLGAPGSWIYSTSINTHDIDHHPFYDHMSGSSIAAPHVTGAIALMLAEFPNLSYREIIAKLLASTDPVEDLQGKTIAGRLNIAKSLEH
jgi:subtilisin family serine protease